MTTDLRTAPPGFLAADDVVDLGHPAVQAVRWSLAHDRPDDVTYARRAFEHVRDRVDHSYDVADPRVTVRASEVAEAGVGLCYAQSHLLVALLRAHGVPAGLCYQRLAAPSGGHVVHGLVAVSVAGRWHRLDPRGTDVAFDLVREALVYTPDPARGERDVVGVFTSPPEEVLSPLRGVDDVLRAGLATDLPDRPGSAGESDVP
ncbi:transglutaminase family protein [Klenkia sp. LSe6-5]|uniref:Transglutaminase family protein n=1 Tax=Klenkia sesuvii TaxID=3103137 RepID=A0ABU8DNQ4_9ACTN